MISTASTAKLGKNDRIPVTVRLGQIVPAENIKPAENIEPAPPIHRVPLEVLNADAQIQPAP
jgi:hypothetical protein